ncbi:MAG TPA: HAD family hydrolase [Bradyrhizobium sp.]|nr:HAD family hydrolase [Bradyrhizobium sp.]
MSSPLRDIDLVIFDCDGVLVDSEVLSCQCLSETLATYGIKLGLAEALELFLGRNTAAVLQYYGGQGRPIPDSFLNELKSRVSRTFQTALQPIPGVAALLDNLDAPFCLASSSDIDRVSLSLARTDLASYFGDRLYTSQMVARGKPAPDLFLYAAAKMQAAPARTLVIEDSISGVTAAKAAGMKVWGFFGGSHYESRDGRAILRAAGADRVFQRMADFWMEG